MLLQYIQAALEQAHYETFERSNVQFNVDG